VLASAGTGDVLTGIVAALLAAGRPTFEAAALAAWWHGATADRSNATDAGFGLLASELADGLPSCAAEIRNVEAMGEPDANLDVRFP
jgi:NAD(P)H-hydrate repair Nnr-like enzyme with NAD(P)H-hydrate dehydratase domain